MGFVNIVGSYDVFPLSILLWWIEFFPLISRCHRIEYFYGFENTWCMSCGMNTWGDNGSSYWFTWCMLWHSTCGFPRWHWGNICIGVDARFYNFSPIETLGSLCSSLCGLSIMNVNLLWCYFSTNSWLDRSERIACCYFSMNYRIRKYAP